MSEDMCKVCPSGSDCSKCEFFDFSAGLAFTALCNNDVERLTKHLRALGISEDGCQMSNEDANAVGTLINSAIADLYLRCNSPITEDTMMALVKLIAPAVDIFMFGQCLVMTLPKERLLNLPSPSKQMIHLILEDKVSDFCREVSLLDEDGYYGLLKHLAFGGTKSIHRACFATIIEYACTHDLAAFPAILTWMMSGIIIQGLRSENDRLNEEAMTTDASLLQASIKLALIQAKVDEITGKLEEFMKAHGIPICKDATE